MTPPDSREPGRQEAPQPLNCMRCSLPFVPPQEIEEALDLLRQAGMGDVFAVERRALLQTCTNCKNHLSVHSLKNLALMRPPRDPARK